MKAPCGLCGKVRSYMPEAIRKRLEEVERRMKRDAAAKPAPGRVKNGA